MRTLLKTAAILLAIATLSIAQTMTTSRPGLDESIFLNFQNPPMDCRPHTFWFWPGTAVTKEEITWELEQMHDQGMGGVLINSAFPPVYEKGAIPFLSDEHLAMLRHSVLTAKRLQMKVTLNFSGGWVFGGFWVPPEERSQSLVPADVALTGPQEFSGSLPKFKNAPDHRGEIQLADIPNSEKLVAVIAGKMVEGKLVHASMVDLTAKVRGGTLAWSVPAGTWRLMAFWLKYTGQRTVAPDYGQVHWCVDHFSRKAMQHYCDYIGGKYYQAVGDEFGKPVEALHCDSFEMASLPNGFYWSDSLMAEFARYEGYDLAIFLPALWWPVDDLSPKIRYDVNEFLDHAGQEIFFKAFLDWCHAHHINASMEPYGFTTDILKGAGLVDRPVLEVTPGEKDGVPWFDTRIGPKRYVSSGADLYGRNIIGVEAYTYIHWEIYRATLEELKIASDGFLCSGANKFFNHLYGYTPEREAAPSRTLPWEVVLNHTNIWWKYYRLLADYVGRSCYLLRQGSPQKDIAVYSPLANQWTLNVQNARKWTREFYWGELGKLITANGYNFDLINDDVLLNRAQLHDGNIKVGDMSYRILILPNIQAMPVATLEKVQQYARDGGVVIALERTPDRSTGFVDGKNSDERVCAISRDLFTEPIGDDGTGQKPYGKGYTHFIKLVIDRQDILDWRSSILDPFVNTLRQYVSPDLAIDFAMEGLRENNGLSFIHRRMSDMDIYFVSNIQDRPCRMPVVFRVQNKIPWLWNPYHGTRTRIWQYRTKNDGLEIPLSLGPYESAIYIFQPGQDSVHVAQSNFTRIQDVRGDVVQILADHNGEQTLVVDIQHQQKELITAVQNIPAPFYIDRSWHVILEGRNIHKVDTLLNRLVSWTEIPAVQHFSGTGIYETTFTLPSHYLASDLELELDLGRLGNVAEVEVNGNQVGTCWMRNQVLNITGVVKKGSNRLVIEVTNTLINRVSAMNEPLPIPEELVPHYGSGTSPYSATFQGSFGFKPLPASGLLGPVRILASKKVNISLK